MRTQTGSSESLPSTGIVRWLVGFVALILLTTLMVGAWLLAVLAAGVETIDESSSFRSPPSSALPAFPGMTEVLDYDGYPSGAYRIVFFQSDTGAGQEKLVREAYDVLESEGWTVESVDGESTAQRDAFVAGVSPRRNTASIPHDFSVTLTWSSSEAGVEYWDQQEVDSQTIFYVALGLTGLWAVVLWKRPKPP